MQDNWTTIYSRYSSGFLITKLVKVITYKSNLKLIHSHINKLLFFKSVCENFATKEDAEYVEVEKKLFLFFKNKINLILKKNRNFSNLTQYQLLNVVYNKLLKALMLMQPG